MSKELFFVLSIPLIINLQVTYPTLEEENLHSSCVIDVDPIPSFEIHVQHDIHIPISLEADYSGHLVKNKANLFLLPSLLNFRTVG